MPQLDSISYIPQIFWVIFNVFLLYLVINKRILPLFSRIFWVRKFKRNSASGLLDRSNQVKIKLLAIREKLLICLNSRYFDLSTKIFSKAVDNKKVQMAFLWSGHKIKS